jgi:transcriptional regulator with XRE-family HTH domain
MNKHLEKAAEYITKGTEFYLKAAEEILAARREDGLSQQEIADQLGKPQSWVSATISWYKDYLNTGKATPHAGEYQRVKESLARTALREATPAEARELVESLPLGQRHVIRKAIEHTAPRAEPAERRDPTFMAMIVALTERIIEMKTLVEAWHGPEAVPADFELSTFTYLRNDLLAVEERIRDLRNDPGLAEFKQIIASFEGV